MAQAKPEQKLRHHAGPEFLSRRGRSQCSLRPASSPGSEVRPLRACLPKSSAIFRRRSVAAPSARASGIAVQVMVGDPVCQGDVIETAADGRIGIRFIDGTVFNLSRSTRVVLNEFVCDSNGTSHSALFGVTTGTFAFIAGRGGKDRLPQGRHACWKHSRPRPYRRDRHAVAHRTDLLG